MSGEEKQEREVVFSAEFDDFNCGPMRKPVVIDVLMEAGVGMSVGLTDDDGVRHELFNTWRDQWGVYVSAHGSTGSIPTTPQIAQEDQTRSFLDAMIRALKVLRYYNEFGTKPADVVVGADVEKKAEEASKKDLPDSP
jgi:hypothetical protein